MSNLLKDVYSAEFYACLWGVMETSLEGFDRARFLARIFSPEFVAMELKQRMSHILERLLQPVQGALRVFPGGAHLVAVKPGFVGAADGNSMVMKFRPGNP